MPIVRTKLHRPPATRDYVHRARLIKALERGSEQPLTLISAPAGYGKSTLLAAWLEAAERPSAWLSLDPEDSAPGVFLAHLLAALETIAPGAFPETRDLLAAPQLPPERVLAARVQNELDGVERDFTLVLDDFQAVHGTVVHDLIAALLRHPPPVLHLVISTRSDPPLPLASLRAQGALTELRARDLRFTEDETLEFLSRALGARVEHAASTALTQETEGWAAGLRLAVLSSSDAGDLERHVEKLRGSSGYARDYLLAEVLSRQPPPVLNAMLASAITNRFCAPLVDALCADGAADVASLAGSEFVDGLARQSLFAIPLDDDGRWFRYHHVFLDCLRSQLQRRRDASAVAALHARASTWFEHEGMDEEALQHALAAGDADRAAALVERGRHALLDREEWLTLAAWIERLPPDLVQRRPALLTSQIFLAALRWRFDLIPPLLSRGEELLAQGESALAPAERSSLTGELELAKCWLALPASRGDALVKYARSAELDIPADHAFLRGTLEILLAVGQQMNGLGVEAAAWLESKLLEGNVASSGTPSRLWSGLVSVYLLDGDLSRAERAGSRIVGASGAQAPLTSAWADLVVGVAHYQWDRLDSASRHFATIVEGRYSAPGRCGHEGMVGLTLVRMARGETDAAREAAERCLELANEMGIERQRCEAQSLAARVALAGGDLGQAVRWQRSTELAELMFGISQLEMPALTWCRVLLAEGSPESRKQAGIALASIRALVERLHHRPFAIAALAVQAVFEESQGAHAVALEAVERALALGARGRPLRVFADLGPEMACLLARVDADRVDSYYVADILAAFPEPKRAQPRARVTAATEAMREPLSNRELDVLELLAQRLRNKEIAARLFISSETVKKHTAAIYQKLSVTSRREAVIESAARGILRDL